MQKNMEKHPHQNSPYHDDDLETFAAEILVQQHSHQGWMLDLR